jgi:hypothetical protein
MPLRSEAARPGDAGEAFAVLVSEVRSLARYTAKAAEEIAWSAWSAVGPCKAQLKHQLRGATPRTSPYAARIRDRG